MVFGIRHITNQMKKLKVMCESNELEIMPTVKYLAIILDFNLAFDDHVTSIRNKLIARCKMLGKLRPLIGSTGVGLSRCSLQLSDCKGHS